MKAPILLLPTTTVSLSTANTCLFQTVVSCPMKGRPEAFFLEQFSEKFMDHVRQVCTFAKSIPGFKCLHHEVRLEIFLHRLASFNLHFSQDQVSLLKSCVFEVLLVRLSGLFDNQVSFPFLWMIRQVPYIGICPATDARRP